MIYVSLDKMATFSHNFIRSTFISLCTIHLNIVTFSIFFSFTLCTRFNHQILWYSFIHFTLAILNKIVEIHDFTIRFSLKCPEPNLRSSKNALLDAFSDSILNVWFTNNAYLKYTKKREREREWKAGHNQLLNISDSVCVHVLYKWEYAIINFSSCYSSGFRFPWKNDMKRDHSLCNWTIIMNFIVINVRHSLLFKFILKYTYDTL